MSTGTGHRIELPTVESDHPTRRVFTKVVIGAVGCAYAGMIGYPVYRYLNSPAEKAEAAAAVSEVTLPKADELPPGSALIFKFGAKPALLIHQKDGSWSALSAVCTHLACTVQYEPAEDRIFCACHGGVYDPKTGANRSGPPPRPLEQYKVARTPGSVTVSRG
jgi:cytochrome b6-f complex iron-sulfur subunit